DPNEGPQHKVMLDGFWIGKYQVTQDQWRKVMGKNPSLFEGSGRLPVDNVSRITVLEFCKKVSAETGNAYALPTEAQWEYACRAGTTTPFHFGSTISTDQANYNGNFIYGDGKKRRYWGKPMEEGILYRGRTTEVGIFPANGWGIYDMHGNLYEWCADWYAKNYFQKSPECNPPGPNSGAYGVLRGGACVSGPGSCRSSYRLRSGPSIRTAWFGFRVCLLPRLRLVDARLTFDPSNGI
ncbi:formylglycine-generating enzyme family protein, partial [Candidatus Sumerlaeota bacterium]|nr:formylglycine-generating enzyme family protein [Candidatus Sumerlaeota bacterium]